MSEWTPLADEAVTQLVDRAIQRDPEAFGALYDAYLGPVYRYLYYRLGNQTDAEDLCEQVFLKAWEAIHRFRWQGRPFVAWLYRMAHNTLVDYRRTRKFPAPFDDATVQNRAAPHDWVEAQLRADELGWAIAQLTDEQQQVIVLKFVQGMNNSEIAETMGKREGAIRALQLRGLMALRRLLAEERRE